MFRLIMASVVAVASIVIAAPATAQESTGTVTVVHGVPGLTVDVYANGNELIPDFEPGAQFGPAELPAGDYDLAIRAAGSAADSDPAISGSTTLPAGANATIVAHLDAAGTPTLSVFVNDTSEIPSGQARLTVRHTAAFGAVDVLAGGAAIFQAVTNPNEGTIEVAAGDYDVSVTAAGDPSTVAFNGELTLQAGTAYLVHAIGDPTAETFSLVIQTIDGLGAQVLGERLARTGTFPGFLPMLLIALVLVMLGTSMRVAYRRAR